MKILHVINSLSMGGAEELVADLAPLQRERGNDVEVLLLRGGESTFRTNLENAKIRVYDFGKGISVYSPINVFRLIPFMRKYDVIHVHLFPAQYWVAIAKLLSFSKVRLVTTEHSVNNRRRGVCIWRPFDCAVYTCYSSIACCSDAVKVALCRYLGGWRRICTIPNGVNIAKIVDANSAARKDFSIPEDAFLLCQVARFIWPKDQDTIIRSLVHLPEYVHAVFIGDGERRKICEGLVDKMNLHGRVHFLGIRENIPALVKMANVVVCSSEFEGLSLASVEGLASGRPVVASDVPGLREIIGGAGLLFPFSDEIAFAEKIRGLLEDSNCAQEVGSACLSRSLDFDISRMEDSYLQIYES